MKRIGKMLSKVDTYQKIALKDLEEPAVAVRTKMDSEAMDALVESIKQVGVIEPLIVMIKGKRFEVIAGDRRRVAAKKAGLKEVPCVVTSAEGGRGEMLKLHENLAREDVNVIDEARYLHAVKKRLKLDQKQLAKMLSRSEGYVSQRLSLLEWPDYLLTPLLEGTMTYTVARELARIKDLDVMREYVRHATRSGITPALAKEWVDDWLRMEESRGRLTEKERERVGVVVTREIELPCSVCNEPHKVSETVMVRVCKGCAEKVGL